MTVDQTQANIKLLRRGWIYDQGLYISPNDKTRSHRFTFEQACEAEDLEVKEENLKN